MGRTRYSIIGALLAVLGAAPLHAQSATGAVGGRIVDESTQQPLAGVQVSIANRGSITRDDGVYLITNVPVGTYNLRTTMIGYAETTQSVTVAAGETAVVNLALSVQVIGLSEIVATGYGHQRAGDITGSVKQVNSAQFNTGAVVSPQKLIQSKIAGVQVVDNNEPGGGLSVRIRGATSINASSEPLYVIDGQPLGTGAGGGIATSGRDALNFLNPEDVESITVLKDASAAAIYGANAANGVVLITTKRGQGGPQLLYNGSVSASAVTRLPDVLNAEQFAAAVQEYAPARTSLLLNANTDWFNEIARTGYGQEHNVALSGSGETNAYRLSMGYTEQTGVIRSSSTDRLSLGVNYDQRLFDDAFKLTLNVKGSRQQDQLVPSGVIGNAASMAPTQPVLDPTSATGYWDWNTTNASPSNPLATAALAKNNATTYRSVGNVQAGYAFPFVTGLKANLNLGYDVGKMNRTDFVPNNLAAEIRERHGLLSLTNNTEANSVLEGYLTYAAPLSIVPGAIDLTGGYSYTGQHRDNTWYTGTGLTSNLLGENGITSADNVANGQNITDYKLISFFGRLNYNVSDRYLLAATLRHDGSSRFGAGNQWGTFPSVSVGWRISNESFLRDVAGLSDLKLRASWAKTGNQAFGDYLQYSTYTYSDPLTQYQFGDEFVTTIRPSAVDPNIHWESTESWDVGLDYGFMNQRFSGSIDWYVKNTNDLIFTIPVAAGTNLSNYVTTNIGSMKNQGVEVSLDAKLLDGGDAGLSWTADFTASHNTNELTSINPTQSVSQILTGGISGGVGNNVEVFEPGSPIRSFFVYEQLYDDNGNPIEGSYADLNNDGLINDSDRRPFHDPSPKWMLGHSSYFNYHKVDVSFTLRAYLGSYVYNNVASSLGAYQNLTGAGMPANLDASVLETGFVVPQYYSDYYVQDASFLRMDNISLGYGFSYRGQPLRIFGTVQNAFTITGYNGVDPTAGLNGIDNNIYPRSRTFTAGLNVRF